MSTYELDDDLVQGLIDNADLLPPRLLTGVMALKAQIPIPAPTKVGAVVRTESRVLVRTAGEDVQFCWWDITNHVGWAEGAELGRIVEVLSEGVDL